MATLYTTYRPDSFEDIIGNEAAVNSLQKALKRKNHSHVYLLSGPAGTGKTTLARIMAKELGASEVDIREINTSSNRGIDTAREIIQQIRMMPMDGDSIVYILDECHKFTNDMQNALLKPLEDTPDHVYFFLCTTDPSKLIKAIRSRCSEIKTSPLTIEHIYSILKRIVKLEEIAIKKETLTLIAENAEGIPRSALVMLEQIIDAENDVEIKKILASKGNEDDVEIIELARLLLRDSGNWGDIAKLLKKLKDNGKLDDAETVRYIVMGYMSVVLLSGKLNKRAATVLEAFAEPTYNTGKNGIILACLNVIL